MYTGKRKDVSFIEAKEYVAKLKADGWEPVSLGRTHKVPYDRDFSAYIRYDHMQNWQDKIDYTGSACVSLTREGKITDAPSCNSEQPNLSYAQRNINNDSCNMNTNREIMNGLSTMAVPPGISTGSKHSMGYPIAYSEPLSDNSRNDLVTSSSQLPSLIAARSGIPSFVIALDTEFVGTPRVILSYQFAYIINDRLCELMVLPKNDRRLPLSVVLGYIFDSLDMTSYLYSETRRYKAVTGFDSNGKPIETSFVSQKEAEEAALRYYVGNAPMDISIDAFMSMSVGEQMKRYSVVDEVKYNMLSDYERKHGFKLAAKSVQWNDYSAVKPFSTDVTILCHAGKVDLSALDLYNKNELNIFEGTSEIQKGICSLRARFVHPNSGRSWWRYYPCFLSFRDTMCFATQKKRGLRELGESVGTPKIAISREHIEHMDKFLQEDPVGFFNYASNDAVVTLLYASKMWGSNKWMPVTLSSAGSKVAKVSMTRYLGVTEKEFDLIYRGLVPIRKGLKQVERKTGDLAFIAMSGLEPVSDDARQIMSMAQLAYKGGYNGCISPGFYSHETFDYDLKNAYPTCMCLVPDIAWSYERMPEDSDEIYRLKCEDYTPIEAEYRNAYASEQMFHTPFDPLFAYVTFEFPKSVEYPCIPVSVDGSMIFPRTSNGIDGVYASGPDIYLALRLGAIVKIKRGFMAKIRRNPDRSFSRCLGAAVAQMVEDREQAKYLSGKGSLDELSLKQMVCSIYGKTAQNVLVKNTWSSRTQEMENLGCSEITSPTHSALITSGVRCVLLAAMNQISMTGYHCYSVTTDGFISDAPEAVLNRLDLYGFGGLFRAARQFLTHGADDSMWEMKHWQNDLLNITTRGNVSLSQHGVCAHNSYSTGEVPDSFEDRLLYMSRVMGRKGRLTCKTCRWITYKEMVIYQADFSVDEVTRDISMDFDMKRAPVKESICPVRKTFDEAYLLKALGYDGSEQLVTIRDCLIEDADAGASGAAEKLHSLEAAMSVVGETYEIANIDSKPYESVNEFLLYRQSKASCNVIRTEADWNIFFTKVELRDRGIRVQVTADFEWRRLYSCIAGYRLGLWVIPELESDMSVGEKCNWINGFNKSEKQFKPSDWKNCRKPERASKVLPRDMISDLLQQMGAVYVC